jgi:LemA protein
MVFGYKEKPQFTVENEREISRPPQVDFGAPAKPSTPVAPGGAPAPAPTPAPTPAPAPTK